ncbi:polysaccharide pyruvyl transferase family protein [Chloroflexota bacterium]
MSKEKYFIFGYFGWKNVGDDAMLNALLQEIHSCNPEAKFAVLSRMPVVIPSQVHARTTFVKPSPFAVFWWVLKSTDVIVSGGTWIHDYGKRLTNIRTLIMVFIFAFFVKVSMKKLYFIGHGVGPLTTLWGKFLTRMTYKMGDYISTRDTSAYKILTLWNFKDKTTLGFDLSALLKSNETTSPLLGKNKENISILGISVTPVFEIYRNRVDLDVLMIEKIAEPINEWLERESTAEVHLIVFKGKSKDDDVTITKLLEEHLHPAERVKLIDYDPDPKKMLAAVGHCSLFLGSKYHSCLFAYISNLPLVIIDYHPKCRVLAKDIGLPDHAVISLNEVLTGQFRSNFENLVNSPADYIATLPIDTARQRARENINRANLC